MAVGSPSDDRQTQTSPNKQVGKQPPATVNSFLAVIKNEHLSVKIRQNAMLEFINWHRSMSFERPNLVEQVFHSRPCCNYKAGRGRGKWFHVVQDISDILLQKCYPHMI